MSPGGRFAQIGIAVAVAVTAGATGCGGGARAGAGKGAGEGATKAVTRVPVSDDEPTDGVEITSERGRMDPAVVETGIAPHKDALGECYTAQVGRRGWLGGQVLIHWDIRKDGTITAVKLAESDLGAWPIEKCLLEIARAATFGKPIGGDADFSIPLQFSLKGKVEIWDEERALRAVGGQVAALDACDKAKGVSGPPPEDVLVTVYVGAQGAKGKAQSVGFASAASVIDDAWAECAEQAALGWRLPPPKGAVAKLAVRFRAREQ